MTLLESKDSSKLNSSMLDDCEFVKFSFRQKYKAYGIATNIAHAKIFLFNAHQKVCSWLKDFKITFILCNSLYYDYNYAYFA